MADMRLIDADALDLRKRVPMDMGGLCFIEDVETAIEQASTIDAVPVVRCKDCKIAFANPFIADYPQLVCRKWANWHIVEPDDFCSYGERKDDGA